MQFICDFIRNIECDNAVVEFNNTMIKCKFWFIRRSEKEEREKDINIAIDDAIALS